ncbi:hypothetical protein PMSD_25945 [Paenibacillus macquariensis subsp. defensor]|nr:hypothetical protein PMSD_25945 [Paenibacillus macquariensis subsp. defensor]
MSRTVLTSNGKERIKAEIEAIKISDIPRVQQKVKDAEYVDQADLVEYAKEELEFYERRLQHLENMISTAKVVGANE